MIGMATVQGDAVSVKTQAVALEVATQIGKSLPGTSVWHSVPWRHRLTACRYSDGQRGMSGSASGTFLNLTIRLLLVGTPWAYRKLCAKCDSPSRARMILEERRSSWVSSNSARSIDLSVLGVASLIQQDGTMCLAFSATISNHSCMKLSIPYWTSHPGPSLPISNLINNPPKPTWTKGVLLFRCLAFTPKWAPFSSPGLNRHSRSCLFRSFPPTLPRSSR